jgi:hypothetical protein
MASRHKLTRYIAPDVTGLSGATLAAERTSNNLSTAGFDQLTIFIDYTYSAASAVTMTLEASDDNGSTWYRTQTGSISSGTVTLSSQTFTKSTGSADQTFVVNQAINYDMMRIKVAGTSGDTGDLVTVSVRLGSL